MSLNNTDTMVLLSQLGDGFDITQETVQSWETSVVYENLAQLRNKAGSAAVQALREMAKERQEEHKMLCLVIKEFDIGTGKNTVN